MAYCILASIIDVYTPKLKSVSTFTLYIASHNG